MILGMLRTGSFIIGQTAQSGAEKKAAKKDTYPGGA